LQLSVQFGGWAASTLPQASLLAADTHSLASTAAPQLAGAAAMHEVATMFSQSALGVPPQAFARAHHALAASLQSGFPPHPIAANARTQEDRNSILIGSSRVTGG
jgi:hypothetical protein